MGRCPINEQLLQTFRSHYAVLCSDCTSFVIILVVSVTTNNATSGRGKSKA